MTIAATNFLAAMTGNVAGATPMPAAGFSAAIGTALTDPLAEPLAGKVTPAAVLTTGLVSEAALVVGDPILGAEKAVVDTADLMQPAAGPDEPAPVEPHLVKSHDLDRPTMCAPPAPFVKPQVAAPSDDVPLAETLKPTDDVPEDAVLPEHAFAELQGDEANSPVAAPWVQQIKATPGLQGDEAKSPVAAPWVQQTKATPQLQSDEAKSPVAAPWVQQTKATPVPVGPRVDADVAEAPSTSSRLQSTTDIRIDAPQPVIPASATAFAERVAVAATPPLEGAGIAPAQAASLDARPAAIASEPTPRTARPEQPVVNARSGQIGREMGVEIARHLTAGGNELTVRLNPAEMGRIEVRLSFDEGGTLRAVVAAESAAALEMLRRDQADLGRALTEAGVRADAGSLRFDTRSGGGEGGQFWQRQQQGNRPRGNAVADDLHATDPAYRPMRASGRVDLMA